MAMHLFTTVAMVFCVFHVHSVEMMTSQSLGKLEEGKNGALAVGGVRGQSEEDGHGLSDGDGDFHDDSSKDVLYLHNEDTKDDDEESDQSVKDKKGRKQVADDEDKDAKSDGDKKVKEDKEQDDKDAKKTKTKDVKKEAKKDEGDDEEDDDEDDEDEDDKLVQELDKKLSAARIKKRELEAELKSFEDDNGFAKKLAEDVESIGNETQSFALARFLGNMKASQRQFAKANYEEFLEDDIKKVGKKIEKLRKALDKAEDDGDKKEKKEKKEKDDGAEKKAKEDTGSAHQSAGETFAIAFFANCAMLAVVFGMANAQNNSVKNYTWFLIDQVVAIFLAVMYFQAFDELLSFGAMGVGSHVLSSIMHTVFLLVVVSAVAYYFRKQKVALAILCGAGAHFVSFSSIHTAASLQNKVFVGYSYTLLMCVFGLCVLGLGLGMVCFLAHTAKSRLEARARSEGDETFDDYVDKTDDLENDACATAFSVVWTMLARFVLTGHHPDDDETEFDHTAAQRWRMLMYACVCLIVAAVGIVLISRMSHGATYRKKRVLDFFSTVLAMNVAWSFLYWGEWEFFEVLYPGDPIKGRVMFAVVMTLLGSFLLIGLAEKNGSQPRVNPKVKTVALTALGLVIAFSWELTFDTAIEQMVEGRAHPVFMKVTACLAMLAIILPVYALYMKPITMKAQGALEGVQEAQKEKEPEEEA